MAYARSFSKFVAIDCRFPETIDNTYSRIFFLCTTYREARYFCHKPVNGMPFMQMSDVMNEATCGNQKFFFNGVFRIAKIFYLHDEDVTGVLDVSKWTFLPTLWGRVYLPLMLKSPIIFFAPSFHEKKPFEEIARPCDQWGPTVGQLFFHHFPFSILNICSEGDIIVSLPLHQIGRKWLPRLSWRSFFPTRLFSSIFKRAFYFLCGLRGNSKYTIVGMCTRIAFDGRDTGKIHRVCARQITGTRLFFCNHSNVIGEKKRGLKILLGPESDWQRIFLRFIDSVIRTFSNVQTKIALRMCTHPTHKNVSRKTFWQLRFLPGFIATYVHGWIYTLR